MLGKSPSWQDADGACSGYLVEEAGLPPAARLRQRRVLEAAPLRRLHRRRRGRDLAPARGPLPRPGAVLLRADLRAAPAAGAGRPLAGHRRPGAPALHAPARRARRVPARRRRVGQRGPDRERVQPARVRPGRGARRSARSRCASSPCRTSSPTNAVEVVSTARRRRFTFGADCVADRGAVRVRARHRPAADRGDAAAARAHGHARAPDAGARPASTAARRARAGS